MKSNAVHDYQSAHKLVKKLRGSPKDHPCLDCGAPAQHWRFDHQSNPEHHRLGAARHGNSICSYSLDPWSYLPLCSTCHRRCAAAHRQRKIQLALPHRKRQQPYNSSTSDRRENRCDSMS